MAHAPAANTPSPMRAVRVSDAQLLATAAAAAQRVYRDILPLSPQSDDDDTIVRAKTTLPCRLPELQWLATAPRSSDQFHEIVATIFGTELVAGELLHTVPKEDGDNASTLVVTSATFAKAHLFATNEEWCYVDFTQQQPHDAFSSPSNGDGSDEDSQGKKRRAFMKTLVTIPSSDCIRQPALRARVRRPPPQDTIVAAFLFEEAEDGNETHVSFVGEFSSQEKDPSPTAASALKRMTWLPAASGSTFSRRVVKERLVRVANCIDKFQLIVRRRRLGVQVLVDEARVAAPNSTTCSGGCTRAPFAKTHPPVLLRCALCGYAVCDKCSSLEAREQREHGKTTIHRVRVCAKCMARVDQCKYTNVSAARDLQPVQVESDSPTTAQDGDKNSMCFVLADLLEKTWRDASPSRRASVASVVRYLVAEDTAAMTEEQEHHDDQTGDQYLTLLRSQLIPQLIQPLSLDQCKLANTERRTYLLTHPQDPHHGLLYPTPANEAKRLEAIATARLSELENVPELDIICSIACKELQCTGATISIVEKDTVRVIATNLTILATRVHPRNEGFCSRTILSDKPLIVPHPEADIRFNYMMSVQKMGVSFYCGFPLFSADYTIVIGSLCCLGDSSQRLTQSQFTVMKKLAETTSRVLQRRAASFLSQQP
ncbi:hypothetical protein FI667_g12295, partial [Globisporangium splendens]